MIRYHATHTSHTSNSILLRHFQLGPDGDVKLSRPAPQTLALKAATVDIIGKLKAQDLELDGKSIEDFIDERIRKLLKEMFPGKN